MKNYRTCFALLAAALIAIPSEANDTPDSKRVGELVSVLKSTAGRKEKADACRELATIGTPDAIAPLVNLLADEEMGHMARFALEPMPSSEVDKALRESLSKLSGRPLAGVVSTLGVRRDSKAVKPIAALLVSTDPDVAQAAARALGAIGDSDAAEALEQNLSSAAAANQLSIYEGLLRAAERLQANGKERQARQIYASLQKSSQAPHQVRAAGLRGLILTSDEQGTRVLHEALQSSDYTQFAAAVRTAQEVKSPAMTKVLAAELPKLTADRQIVVVQSLALKADTLGLPAVVNASRSQEKLVKLAAIRALPQFENPTAGPVLLELISDPDKDVAQAAQEALAGVPGRDVDNAIMTMLSNGQTQQRLAGMELVSRRTMSSALPDLSRLAKDADAQVRTAAIRTVGELGGTAQMPLLLDILQHPKGGQDLEAAENALETVSVKPGNSEKAVGTIQAELAKADSAQKAALLRVLTTIGGNNALASVRAAVKDSNPEVRSAAVRALTSWSTPEAAPDLLELARSSSSATEKTVSLRGYLAMAARGDMPEPQRIEMCRNAARLVERAEEKRLLLSALGSINSSEAVQLLEPYLNDAEVKNEAATATVTIADKLLKRDNAAQMAASLVQPLQKVADNASNEKLAERAKELLKKAQAKGK